MKKVNPQPVQKKDNVKRWNDKKNGKFLKKKIKIIIISKKINCKNNKVGK